MQVVMARGGIATTNSFLVADELAKQAVLFDAPDHTVGPLLDKATENGWDIIGLWLTHGHFDHLADHKVVTDRFPSAKVLIHSLDETLLKNPQSSMFPLPFIIPPGKADMLVTDGRKLRIGSIDAEVIHTPGHCPGHVMYYMPRENLLVGGDLIIMGAVGRTDLPHSDPAALNASIRKIMRLPGGTQLLPGHGDPSTLQDERESNPYVQEALAG